jgi:hypothetical protein
MAGCCMTDMRGGESRVRIGFGKGITQRSQDLARRQVVSPSRSHKLLLGVCTLAWKCQAIEQVHSVMVPGRE